MKKALVVCYSLTGMTGGIAGTIAHGLEAELDLIEDATNRLGPVGCLRSALEAVACGLPTIRTRNGSPSDYDLIVVGTPVWAGTMSSPIRSYLFMHRGRFRGLACFCTSVTRGAGSTLDEMQTLAGTDALATFSVTEREIVAGQHEAPLRGFIAALRRTTGMQLVASG